MKTGDLVRYKQPSGHSRNIYGSDGITGIVISTTSTAICVEWTDGQRHVYYKRHLDYMEVVPCK